MALIAIPFLLIITLLLCHSQSIVYASAEGGTKEYTDALADLVVDPNFNPSKYAVDEDDYSLELIHLAESTEGDLLLYVYQPSADESVKAVTVSISEQENNAKNFKAHLYGLEFETRNGVFFKYKVKSFNLSSANEHFYNIVMLQRDFIPGIDSESSGEKVDRIAYGVGQYWRVKRTNGDLEYSKLEYETLVIYNPYTSYIRERNIYLDGSGNSGRYIIQDNYFISFSTNRNIEKLISATVGYTLKEYDYSGYINTFTGEHYSEETRYHNEWYLEKDIYAEETIEIRQKGFKVFWISTNQTYTWKRIQSANDFINTATGVTQTQKDKIRNDNLQWVLMFDETHSYRNDALEWQRHEEAGQCIEGVTILRLEFVEEGVTYNMGTVSNTVTAEFKPENPNSSDNSLDIGSILGRIFQTIIDILDALPAFLKWTVIVSVVVFAIIALIFIVWLFVVVIKWLVNLFKLIFKRKDKSDGEGGAMMEADTAQRSPKPKGGEE